MTAFNVPCPICRTQLKLPNTSLVGKKARCPKCDNRFVITIPATLEVASVDELPVLPLAPQSGRGARWVPDQLQQGYPSPPQPAPAFSSDTPPGRSPESGPAAFSFPTFSEPAAAPGSPHTNAAPTPGVLQRTRGRKRSMSPRTRYITAAATALLLVIIGVVSIQAFRGTPQPTTQKQPIKANLAYQQEQARQAASNESATELSPTSGKPIPLDYLPFTPHVIIHLRPEELWSKDPVKEEFLALLGDLGTWLTAQIEDRTRRVPRDIAELTIALNFGARLTPPDVAMVVRLREKPTHQELVKQFGRMRPDPSVEVYEAPDYSYLVVDSQTFVVAPLLMAEELHDAKSSEATPSPDMEPLLQESDRSRHLTVLFDLPILDSHREDAFIPELQTAADKVLFWFGDQIETVSFSLHLDENCFIETLLRQTTSSTPVKLQRFMQVRLDRLPEEVLGMVRQMEPATVSSRQIIGRFPAMLQAFNIGTTAHAGPGYARLVTLLPRHAAANLAVGTLLTWNQSLLTNFEDPKVTSSDTSSVPEKLVDRLKMKVLVDFRRTPLQEAFGYIGESIKTDVSIDGDALKGAGFTQNMPQTLDLGEVTALEALDGIIKKYAQERDPLVLIVDEESKKLILSTKVKSEADGLTPFDTTRK